jgi:Mrp family chromosome partitioning ATPase
MTEPGQGRGNVERIRRALELARAEREQTARHGGTPAAAASATPVARVRSVSVDAEVLRRWHVFAPGATEPSARAFADLGTRLVPRLDRHGWRTLAVVGPAAEEGKTFTAINLAVALAASAQATAWLIDLDLRAPQLHHRFGFAPQAGIEQVLRGELAVHDAVVNPEGYPGLLLLPARTPVANPAQLLSAESARAVLAELRQPDARRYVIYDLPPVLDGDEVRLVAAHLDAALLVVADERTRRSDVRRCCEALRGVPIVGTVLNGARDARPAGSTAGQA